MSTHHHPPHAAGATMNRRKVILFTTLGIFAILCLLTGAFFHGIPPWPILFWFSISHIFFCVVIWRVKPYRGPYVEPMEAPEIAPWRER